MSGSTTFLTMAVTAGASLVTALGAAIFTYAFAKKREHQSDWRKLKFEQYQEFVLALSGIVRGRDTSEGHRRYADAVNAMSLVASKDVLLALRSYQEEISHVHDRESDERHDYLLDVLLKAMRKDISPSHSADASSFSFYIIGVPPDAN